MSKLLSVLMAGAAGLAINGAALAEQETQSQGAGQSATESQAQGANQAESQAQGNTPEAMEEGHGTGRKTQTQAQEKAMRDIPEYAEAVKRCQKLSDMDRERCMEKAWKDYGEM